MVSTRAQTRIVPISLTRETADIGDDGDHR